MAESPPRIPNYGSVTTETWEVPSLSEYIDAFATEEDQDATQVSQLSQESKGNIASKTILGRASAGTVNGLIEFPVVNADNELNSNALRSAHQLAFNSEEESAIERITETLLMREFGIDLESASIKHQFQADRSDNLTGIIWATGEHTVKAGGIPRTIKVTKDSLKRTYDRLKQKLNDGSIEIGFDHPSDGTVAAETSIGEIGKAHDVEMSKDSEAIVLTDSTITSNKAEEAFQSGEFDGLDYSTVGKVLIERDEQGNREKDQSGAEIVSDAFINRIDVVRSGAVESASVGRIPELATEIAAESMNEGISFTASYTKMSKTNDSDIEDSPETLEAAEQALENATEVIEEKNERIESLEAEKEDLNEEAEAYRYIADSHDADDPQEIIDSHTEETRREIAEMEASLPSEDTTGDSVDERVGELKGKSVDALEMAAGKLARKQIKAQKAGKTEVVTSGESEMPDSEPDEELEDMVDSTLDFVEAAEVAEEGIKPSEYVKREYDIEASNFGNAQSLRQKMRENEVNN